MKYCSKLIQEIKPYVAGEQPKDKKYIKLNTNENPYSPSPKIKAILESYEIENLKLYPDPDATKLKEEVAMRFSLDTENVFIGNGSDEVLGFSFPAFFDPGATVAFHDVTYSFYPVYAKLFHLQTKIVELVNFRADLEKYHNIKADGIIIANPNAPTGIVSRKSDIEKVIATNQDKIVIIDEAYIDFCDESVVDLIPKYDNLLVVHTFSKSFSLAGARCGMALGNKNLIDALVKIKDSFNSYTSNSISQIIALEAFKDQAYHKECINKVIKVRDTVSQRLSEMGFSTTPSSANFLLVKVGQGEKYYLKLKEMGILIRFFNTPKLKEYIRVTVGKFEDMLKFLDAMQKIKDDE